MSKSTAGMLTTIAGVGAGVLAWEAQATAKYAGQANYSLFSTWRFGDALSGLIGGDTVGKILPGFGGHAKVNMTPLGAINKTMATGVAVYIANQIAKSIFPKYKSFDTVPELIDSISTGVAVGGAIGGIFDPNPEVGSTSNASVGIGNNPFARGTNQPGVVAIV